jgi:O-antigen/teichoic acid export membrane protein
MSTAPQEPPGRALGTEERLRLMRDGLINNLAPFVSSLVAIVMVPVMLAGVGRESYGVWVSALALSAILASIDLGLGWSLARALAGGGEREEKLRELVNLIAAVYLLTGLIGWALLALAGETLAAHFGLAASKDAVPVFALVGVAFLFDWLQKVAAVVLFGTRRFDLSNKLSVAGTLLRAGGAVAVLAMSYGIVAVAIWHAACSALLAAASHAVVRRLHGSVRLTGLTLRGFRRHLPFGLASTGVALAGTVIWQMPQLMVGALRGAAPAAMYHIGQRFPLALFDVAGRAAETIFPLASRLQQAGNPAASAEILEAGTRWIVLLALPPAVFLAILAPEVLFVWVREATPETVWVFRLCALVVVVEAFSACSVEVLWARGDTRELLAIAAAGALGAAVIGPTLIGHVGLVGGAWTLLAAVSGTSITILAVASSRLGLRSPALIVSALRGLWAPLIVGSLATVLVATLMPLSFVQVILALGSGLGVFVALFFVWGARAEERRLLEELLRSPIHLARGVR